MPSALPLVSPAKFRMHELMWVLATHSQIHLIIFNTLRFNKISIAYYAFRFVVFFCSGQTQTLVRRRCHTRNLVTSRAANNTRAHIKNNIIEGYDWIWFLFCLSVAFAGEFHTRGVSLAQHTQSIESVSTVRGTYEKKKWISMSTVQWLLFDPWINRGKKKHRMQWPMRMRNIVVFLGVLSISWILN